MADNYDIATTAARVYAEALFQLASDRAVVDDVRGQLQELLSIRDKNPQFAALITSAAIDIDARRAILQTVFTNRVHELILNTMLVMNDKGRLVFFGRMVEAYDKLVDARHGRQRVLVTSAVELTDELRKKIAVQAQRIGGREPVLVEKVDPGVIGGFVLQIGDRLVDASLRMRLRNMRSNLRTQMERRMVDEGHRFITA